MDYNEERVLTTYIWDHYHKLITSFEREVGVAIIGREKAKYIEDSPLKSMLQERLGRIHRVDINEAIQESPENFRHMVRERLLREYPDKIYINRCEKCHCIVRTPVARLCTWCGHSWFDREPHQKQ